MIIRCLLTSCTSSRIYLCVRIFIRIGMLAFFACVLISAFTNASDALLF